MNEISRKEAISSLEAQRDYGIFTARQVAINKAISDMEKLEKIEKLYEPKPFGEGLSREDIAREIEQIVKG